MDERKQAWALLFRMSVNQQPTCIHCGKPESLHKAKTLECPFGKPSRSVGYTSYGPTNFTPKQSK